MLQTLVPLLVSLSASPEVAEPEGRARALRWLSHDQHCGLGSFALMPHHIDPKHEVMLWKAVKDTASQADGCNKCAHVICGLDGPRTRALAPRSLYCVPLRALCVSTGLHESWSPVWAAPSDICAMQEHMPEPTIHLPQCSEGGYPEGNQLKDHVKLCLKKQEIDWLWNHGPHGLKNGHHCRTEDGKPHLGREGLLVCASTLAWNVANRDCEVSQYGACMCDGKRGVFAAQYEASKCMPVCEQTCKCTIGPVWTGGCLFWAKTCTYNAPCWELSAECPMPYGNPADNCIRYVG
jgi:hypothetical protein